MRKNLLRTDGKKCVKYPTHIIIVEIIRWYVSSKQQLSIVILKRFLQMVERRTPGERIKDCSQYDNSGLDLHLYRYQFIDNLNQAQLTQVVGKNRQVVNPPSRDALFLRALTVLGPQNHDLSPAE
jgi:hypothetical protein